MTDEKSRLYALWAVMSARLRIAVDEGASDPERREALRLLEQMARDERRLVTDRMQRSVRRDSPKAEKWGHA
jgi:hypothetical protein